ncbi:MAG TPA: DALR anticodon-binding domain-containing protein, partial [Roseiarcus sp.]
VDALGKLLDTEDGKNLLAGYRRAANILRAEEKKSAKEFVYVVPVSGLLSLPAEKKLAAANGSVRAEVGEFVANGRFHEAMRKLATLREPVDDFFRDVTVNTENSELRTNRLNLLNETREAMHAVADFSKISG